MADYSTHVSLGSAPLKVSRLGIGCSYGVGTSALEEAFERGINYFYFGTLRRSAMAKAVHNLAPRYRDKLVVAIQSYTHSAAFLKISVDLALQKLKIDYADLLILGKMDVKPSKKLVEKALRLRDKGKIRYLVVSAHQRKAFREYINEAIFDAIMVRYNAAHPGAEKEVFPFLPSQNRPGVICYTATRWGTLLQGVNNERPPTASDCYRFVLQQPCVDICLCGPKNRAELEEAFKVLTAPPMSEEEMGWMRRVGSAIHNQKHHNYFLRKLIFD